MAHVWTQQRTQQPVYHGSPRRATSSRVSPEFPCRGIHIIRACLPQPRLHVQNGSDWIYPWHGMARRWHLPPRTTLLPKAPQRLWSSAQLLFSIFFRNCLEIFLNFFWKFFLIFLKFFRKLSRQYFLRPFPGPLSVPQIFSVVTFDDAFPDLAENNFGWTVDPLQPNRVWFMNRLQGTHTGTFVGLGMEVPATGNRVELPPTANSATFNARGQCVKFTTGYVVDREDGTTGGVSALFGILKGIGRPLPFPEAQSYQPSWQFRLFQFLGSLGARAANKD